MRMKLIVGLGNPEAKFKNTRHNLGFAVVDKLVIDQGLSWRYSRDWMCFYIKRENFVVIKPSTYMNKSGEAFKAVSKFFKIAAKDILVIHDELDLQFGKVRISFDSTSAGHKGVASVIESLGGFNFARLRIGLGHPSRKATDGEQTDPEKYVLENFTEEEQKNLADVLKTCGNAAVSFLESGLDAAMNRFN